MERSPAAARVLVVDDDRKTAELVALYLRHAGYTVCVEHAGDRARLRLDSESFDLLVLDVMLPGMSGLELCQYVRETRSTPIVLLTARTSEDQRIEGLELGADDYVCKPFSPRELVARAKSVLRRIPPDSDGSITWGDLKIEPLTRAVFAGGRHVTLTRSEFDMLHALLERPGRVKRRSDLLASTSEPAEVPLDRTVDVHIRNIRKKLDPSGDPARFIETVVGVGYRIAKQAEHRDW